MNNPTPLETKIILDTTDAMREATALGTSLNKELLKACEGLKKGISDPEQLKAIDNLAAQYKKAIVNMQHDTAINGSIVDVNDIILRVREAGLKAVGELKKLGVGGQNVQTRFDNVMAGVAANAAYDKAQNPRKPPQWDNKPNYDTSATQSKPIDVRVINKESDPIPTNFVKAASTISTTLFAQFSALRATVESGHTSIVQAIIDGGGTGGGGGGNNTPQKTTDIIQFERDIQEALERPFQNIQFRGEEVTATGLQDQLREMISQLSRADRDSMSGQDRATTDQLLRDARELFNELSNTLRTQTNDQSQAREGWENNQQTNAQYEAALQGIRDTLRGQTNTAGQDQQSNATGLERVQEMLDSSVDRTGSILDRLSGHITRLNIETRRNSDGFNGGITGLLRDFHMIGVSLPPEISQAMAMGENVLGLMRKFTKSPQMLAGWERGVSRLGARAGGAITRGGERLAGLINPAGRSGSWLAKGAAQAARFGAGGLSSLAGGAATLAGPTAILGLGAAAAMRLWQEHWKERRENESKARQMQDADNKHLRDMRIKTIEQTGKLEMNRINAISELEKKRISNQSELARMRFEMNSADLKSQERLYAIEMKRAEIQTSKAAIKQKQEFSVENFNTNWQFQGEQQAKREKMNFHHGYWDNFLGNDRAYNDAGQRVSADIIELATSHKWGAEEEEMLNRLLSASNDANKEVLTAIKSSLDVQITQEQAVIDQLTSMEGAISAGTREQIQSILDQTAAIREQYSGRDQQQMAWGKLLSDFQRNGVQSLIGNGIEEAYDPDTKKTYYMAKGANGEDIHLGENLVQVVANLNRYLAMDANRAGGSLVDRHESNQEKLKTLAKNLELQKAIGEAEAALSNAYLNHAKAAEELKKALRNDLFKNIVADISNVSKWQDSGAEKLHTQQMYGLEQQQLAQRNDPRYLRNQDAKMGLEITQAFEKQVAELLGSLNRSERRSASNPTGKIGSVQAGQEWAMWEQRNIKASEALFNFQKTKADERFKLEMEYINRRNSAEIEVVNLQKELAIKTMNTALSQWKAKLDTYGKNQYELQKELALGKIDLKYAKSDERFEAGYKLSTADWEQERKQQTQEKVQAVEREGLEEELAQEEALMQERQKLELALLELEFQIRLEQIKYEVQYKAQLEKQQKEMENAEAESFLKAHGEITLEDIAKFRGKNVEDLTESEKRLTAEERIEFGKQMASNYYEGADILRSRLSSKQVKMGDEYVDLETHEKNKRDEFLAQNEEAYNNGSLDEKQRATYEALREVRDNPLTASANATALTTIFNNQSLKDFGQAYLDQGGSSPEAQAAAQAKKDELEARKAGIDANAIFRERWGKIASGGMEDEGMDEGIVNARKTAADWDNRIKDYYKTADLLETLRTNADPELLRQFAEISAQRDSMQGKDIGNKGEEGYVSYKEVSQQAEDVRRQVLASAGYEGRQLEYMVDFEPARKVMGELAANVGRIAVESETEANKQKAELDKDIEKADKELGAASEETTEIDTLLKTLGKDEDAATNAIYAQMDLEEKHAQTNDELLGKILVALDKGVPMRDANGNEMKDENGETMYTNVQDVKKRLAENELASKQARETLQQRNQQRKERVQTEEDAAFQKDSAMRQSNHDIEKARRENEKEKEKAREELRWNQAQRRDQMNADFIKTESKYASAQRQTDTNATLDILRAKDGNEWMKAVMKRNQDSMYNQQTAALEERQRMEMEAYKNSGNVTEENTARLEAKQEQERGQLDSAKQMGDAIRESMNGVGGLRSLVTEGTGGKSGLEDTWERIQAAAFGHVADPTADAISQMNKAQQLNHAALMQLLAKELPAMVQNTAQMKPEAIGRMLRGVGGQIVNNNYHSAGGGLAPGV